MKTSDDIQPLKLTTIDEDSKILIFEHLELIDLISLAETSKELYAAVCDVYKRKYGKTEIQITPRCYRYVLNRPRGRSVV